MIFRAVFLLVISFQVFSSLAADAPRKPEKVFIIYDERRLPKLVQEQGFANQEFVERVRSGWYKVKLSSGGVTRELTDQQVSDALNRRPNDND